MLPKEYGSISTSWIVSLYSCMSNCNVAKQAKKCDTISYHLA